MKLLYPSAIILFVLAFYACVPQQATEYRTVSAIGWGSVPYYRDDYESDGWRAVRDQVCQNADKGFFTDLAFTEFQPCEADHVLSVSEAHHRGASQWDSGRKQRFYLDAENLVASRSEANRAKSNRTPAQVYIGSQPRRHAFDSPENDCEYVAIWLESIKRHQLMITRPELEKGLAFLAACQS